MSIDARVAELHRRLSPYRSQIRDAGDDSLKIIAISKTRTLEEVHAAAAAGLTHFGENYVQEAIGKILATRATDLVWHFTGRIQRNKARDIAQHFQWIHTVDRVEVAQKLSQFRGGAALDVCIQLDVERGERRYGIREDELAALVSVMETLPGLRLRGLMIMPAPGKDAHALRHAFARGKQVFDATRAQLKRGEDWDTLSMGMSDDFELALQEGSNCIRIGTGIFGPRRSLPERTG